MSSLQSLDSDYDYQYSSGRRRAGSRLGTAAHHERCAVFGLAEARPSGNRRFLGENFTDFCRNFGKLQTQTCRKSVSFAPFSREFREIGAKDRDFRQLSAINFPEILTKISEIFTEKSAISVDLQQHFEKNLQKSPKCAKISRF